LGLEDVNSGLVNSQKRAEWILVAGYNFGMADVTAYYSNTELGDAAVKLPKKMTIAGLQAAFPFGAFTVTPGLAMAKDVNGSNASAKDNVNFYTLQAKYDLSKRTALYGLATIADNAAAANKGFNNPKLDSNSYGIEVGVRHSF
jgi:predicted porin